MNDLFESIAPLVEAEKARAKALHGEHYASMHEAVGVLMEELQEGWDEGKALDGLLDDLVRMIRNGDTAMTEGILSVIRHTASLAACEYVQVAAVAQKALDGMGGAQDGKS